MNFFFLYFYGCKKMKTRAACISLLFAALLVRNCFFLNNLKLLTPSIFSLIYNRCISDLLSMHTDICLLYSLLQI